MKKTRKKTGTESTSFWKTIPGIITQITGLIAALTGLMTVLLPLFQAKEPVVVPDGGEAQLNECWTVEAAIPKVIPLSLKNSISSQDYLFWFNVKIDNTCEFPLHLKVSFDFRQAPSDPAVDYDPNLNILDFDVSPHPHTPFERKIDPVFTFLKKDLDADLPVIWSVEDDKQNPLASDSATIRILPKNRVKWDLKMPGKQVPLEFLLASISAWTRNPGPVVTRKAGDVLSEIDQTVCSGDISEYASAWIEKCYRRFFVNRVVVPDIIVWNRFPPKKEQVIRLPSEVVDGGHFDPVETALFLTALTNATGEFERVRFVLIANRNQETDRHAARKTFFFCWRASTTGAQWSAIDIQRAGELSFQENLESSTAILKKLFNDTPELSRGLWQKGVYLDNENTIAAIDFHKAVSVYRIRGLP